MDESKKFNYYDPGIEEGEDFQEELLDKLKEMAERKKFPKTELEAYYQELKDYLEKALFSASKNMIKEGSETGKEALTGETEKTAFPHILDFQTRLTRASTLNELRVVAAEEGAPITDKEVELAKGVVRRKLKLNTPIINPDRPF